MSFALKLALIVALSAPAAMISVKMVGSTMDQIIDNAGPKDPENRSRGKKNVRTNTKKAGSKVRSINSSRRGRAGS